MVSYLNKKIELFFGWLRSDELPLSNYIFSFLLLIQIRNFFEFFSSPYQVNDLTIIHFSFFYVSLALSIILILNLINKDYIENIKIVILGYVLIIFPPILDQLISSEKNVNMSYIIPTSDNAFLEVFINNFSSFFNSPANTEYMGITIGMKIVVFISSFGLTFYIFRKNNDLLKSFLTLTLLYFTFSIYYFMPSLSYLFYKNFIPENQNSISLLNNFYFLQIIFLLTVNSFLIFKKEVSILCKELLTFRTLHYSTIIIIGYLLFEQRISWPIENAPKLITLIISASLAWIYSFRKNNLTDINIDKISNKDRATVDKNFDEKSYKVLTNIILGLSLTAAYITGFHTFMIIIFYIAIFYLYSSWPFRIKRIPIISKIMIGVNTVALLIAGYSLNGLTNNFNLKTISLLILIFGFSSNFIDIKDYEGDKKEKIKTITTMLGIEKSKAIISIFIFLSYLSIYNFLTNKSYFIYFILLGLAQLVFINKKNYSEKPIFIIYIVTIIYFTILFLSGNAEILLEHPAIV